MSLASKMTRKERSLRFHDDRNVHQDDDDDDIDDDYDNDVEDNLYDTKKEQNRKMKKGGKDLQFAVWLTKKEARKEERERCSKTWRVRHLLQLQFRLQQQQTQRQ